MSEAVPRGGGLPPAVSGTAGAKDVARAVKVTLTNGRVDYVVYASNN